AVEIQLPARIAVLREERPLSVDKLVERGATGLRLGNDPGPHRVAHQLRDGLAGVRIVAQQVARTVAQVDQGCADLGVGVAAGRYPAVRAPPGLCAVVCERLRRAAELRATIGPLGRE